MSHPLGLQFRLNSTLHRASQSTSSTSQHPADNADIEENSEIGSLPNETTPVTPTRARIPVDLSQYTGASSSSLIMSSPIVGTKAEKSAKRRGKARRKRDAERQALEAQKREEKHSFFSNFLRELQERSYSLFDFMEYIFNPVYGQGVVRWTGFFAKYGAATRVLNWWNSGANSPTAREEVREWATQCVEKAVASEARRVTKDGFLKTPKEQPLDSERLEAFSLDGIFARLRDDYARVTMRIMKAFSLGPWSEKHGLARKARERTVMTSAAMACLGVFNNSNNLFKKIFGLYLYTTGAQRQVITIAANLGQSESYSTIVEKGSKSLDGDQDSGSESDSRGDDTRRKVRKPGTLRWLSSSLRESTRVVAKTGLFATVYDNINFMSRNAEQIMGRHDGQENGTCATVFPLWKTKLEDLETAKLRESFDTAGPLNLEDILLSKEERPVFRRLLIHTICGIAIKFGNKEGFKRLEAELEKHTPLVQPIELHKTDLYPLPTMHIDESTITGNAEVDAAIVEKLELRKRVNNFWERVRILAGDQLSLARVRAIQTIRAGNEGGYGGFTWAVFMPGLFHVKIADMHGFFTTHFGSTSGGTDNPGSLCFHNTRLDRLPITPTSLPTFRVCRDLIFVSLYARILHCLLLVSKADSLDDYAEHLTWEALYSDAERVLDKYADSATVDRMRTTRRNLGGKPEDEPIEWDMVFENGLLFNRDALISRLFTDVIKRGDSGGVLLVLKTWALSFRGNGRTKYAYELLLLIHNLTTVWPKPIREIILKNWLINTTGHANRWLEVDLMQEHQNYWIKIFYKARGGVPWEWLSMISPCINTLRQLSNDMKVKLGSNIGAKHAPVDLTRDIETLMSSLDDHDVYRFTKGRRFEDKTSICPDVIVTGLQNLTDGASSPLTDYNTSFSRLQMRMRRRPLVEDYSDDESDDGLNNSSVTPHSGPDHGLQSGNGEGRATPSTASHTPETSDAEDDALSFDSPEELEEGSDSEEEVTSDEEESESARILADIHAGETDSSLLEPTLGLENAEDVEYDMDEEEDLDEEEQSWSDGDSDDIQAEDSDSDSDSLDSEGSERDGIGGIDLDDEDIFTA